MAQNTIHRDFVPRDANGAPLFDGTCYYCRILSRKVTPVVGREHDRRGCYDVCAMHQKWKRELSYMRGHSPNCPDQGLVAYPFGRHT